ncbi:MAG TPA: hypothetical protein VNP04_05245 [Alphaproteobacteria bacterium]|nr:hypothetical protein [Alphaproteobacteria bacterium]
MTVQAHGLLAVWTDIPAAVEDDFNRWYNEEHMAERLAIPGFLTARRYVSLEGTPKYIALYDTVDAQVLQSDAYLKVSNNPTPWTQRVRPHFSNFIRNEYELILTLGTIPVPTAPYIMMARLETAPEYDAEFNDWYNTDHLPALTSVPGVYGARRYRAIVGFPKYLAIYELANGDVPKSDAWKKAADSPWTQKMRPRYRNLAINLGRLLKAMP